MKSFLVTMVLIFAISAGVNMARRPGEVMKEPSIGVLFVSALSRAAIAVWALVLLTGGAT